MDAKLFNGHPHRDHPLFGVFQRFTSSLRTVVKKSISTVISKQLYPALERVEQLNTNTESALLYQLATTLLTSLASHLAAPVSTPSVGVWWSCLSSIADIIVASF